MSVAFNSMLSGTTRITEAYGAVLQENSSSAYGLEKSRVVLDCFKGDSRFSFNILEDTCNPFLLIYRKLRFVCINIRVDGSTKPVYVNVGSLAKRLLLTEEQIWSKSTEDAPGFEKFISDRCAAMSMGAEVLNHFQYDANREIRNKRTREKSALDTLLKIGAAFHSSTFQKPLRQKEYLGKETTIGDKRYLACRTENTVHIYETPLKNENSGSFGAVYKVKDFATGKFYALKASDPFSEAPSDPYRWVFNNEKRMQNWNNRERSFDNLQTNYEQAFLLPAAEKGKVQSILVNDYIAGKVLSAWLKEEHTPKERIAVCKKLSQALVDMSYEARSAHGDLKPENIIIDVFENPVIIDWAGSCPLKTKEEWEKKKNFEETQMYTHGYTDKEAGKLISKSSRKAQDRLAEVAEKRAKANENFESTLADSKKQGKNNLAKAKKLLDEAVKADKKAADYFERINKCLRYQDFYAMVRIYIEVLTGDKVDSKGKFTRETKNKVPKEVNDFVVEMRKLPIEKFDPNTTIRKYHALWQAA